MTDTLRIRCRVEWNPRRGIGLTKMQFTSIIQLPVLKVSKDTPAPSVKVFHSRRALFAHITGLIRLGSEPSEQRNLKATLSESWALETALSRG